MAHGAKRADASQLEGLLGHTFRDAELLTRALTHKSLAHESAGRQKDNEQLEFLGDAVLGLLAAESLWKRYPESAEGELSRFRASVVSRKHLGQVGARLKLGRYLHMGQSVAANGGRASMSLASNAVEALIAALYLDGGLEAARQFVEREVLGEVLFQPGDTRVELEARAASTDSKTALQEYMQARALGRPSYRLAAESGPDHQRVFEVEVSLPGGATARGQDKSKKGAEQLAAAAALDAIGSRNE